MPEGSDTPIWQNGSTSYLPVAYMRTALPLQPSVLLLALESHARQKSNLLRRTSYTQELWFYLVVKRLSFTVFQYPFRNKRLLHSKFSDRTSMSEFRIYYLTPYFRREIAGTSYYSFVNEPNVVTPGRIADTLSPSKIPKLPTGFRISTHQKVLYR